MIGSWGQSTAERVVIDVGAIGRAATGTVVEVRGNPSLSERSEDVKIRLRREEREELGRPDKTCDWCENLELWSRELEQGYRIHVAIYIT